MFISLNISGNFIINISGKSVRRITTILPLSGPNIVTIGVIIPTITLPSTRADIITLSTDIYGLPSNNNATMDIIAIEMKIPIIPNT